MQVLSQPADFLRLITVMDIIAITIINQYLSAFWQYYCIKGTVHQKIKIVLFTHPHVVSNLYQFLS